jgi:hypothetical protein
MGMLVLGSLARYRGGGGSAVIGALVVVGLIIAGAVAIATPSKKRMVDQRTGLERQTLPTGDEGRRKLIALIVAGAAMALTLALWMWGYFETDRNGGAEAAGILSGLTLVGALVAAYNAEWQRTWICAGGAVAGVILLLKPAIFPTVYTYGPPHEPRSYSAHPTWILPGIIVAILAMLLYIRHRRSQ